MNNDKEIELYIITVVNPRLIKILNQAADVCKLNAKTLRDAAETLALCKTVEESNRILSLVIGLLLKTAGV